MKPVQLLPDAEAAFGHCAGTGPRLYTSSDGKIVPGLWNMPAFLHKSGGWGGQNDDFSNICFSHFVPRQYYYRGGGAFNVCHFNPLGAQWRAMCCESSLVARVHTPESDAFCDD